MNALDQLSHQLSKLPGIGKKTALRLALHIVKQPREYAHSLSSALLQSIEDIRFCQHCCHLTDQEICTFCENQKRNQKTICVVEQSSDLMAIERAGSYQGLYHVLQGSLSPIDGIGPDQLRFSELLARLHQAEIEEIILATNPNVNGDATALYLSKLVQPFSIRVTKLASGLPVGADIEYIDRMTLSRALESRREYN